MPFFYIQVIQILQKACLVDGMSLRGLVEIIPASRLPYLRSARRARSNDDVIYFQPSGNDTHSAHAHYSSVGVWPDSTLTAIFAALVP